LFLKLIAVTAASLETYRADHFEKLGLPTEFAQDNQPFSRKGVTVMIFGPVDYGFQGIYNWQGELSATRWNKLVPGQGYSKAGLTGDQKIYAFTVSGK
jgi:hypothetical protein